MIVACKWLYCQAFLGRRPCTLWIDGVEVSGLYGATLGSTLYSSLFDMSLAASGSASLFSRSPVTSSAVSLGASMLSSSLDTPGLLYSCTPVISVLSASTPVLSLPIGSCATPVLPAGTHVLSLSVVSSSLDSSSLSTSSLTIIPGGLLFFAGVVVVVIVIVHSCGDGFIDGVIVQRFFVCGLVGRFCDILVV
jgi:hypothetical protein